jgi:hypothetical protein
MHNADHALDPFSQIKGNPMAKLYVILAGLLGVVKRGESGVVLARRVDREEQVHGHKVPPHVAKVFYRDKDQVSQEKLLKSEDVQFPGNPEDELEIESREMYLDLTHLLHVANRPTITKPGCTSVKVGRDCEDLLATRVLSLKGNLYPVQIKGKSGELTVLGKPKVKIKARYRPEDRQKKGDFARDLVANGVLLEADYGASSATLKIGGDQYLLGKAKAEDLRRIGLQESTEAFIVWIENLPASGGHDHGLDTREELEDMHLWFLYDFLVDDNQADRWVPFVKLPTERDESGGGKRVVPGSQCITPIMP